MIVWSALMLRLRLPIRHGVVSFLGSSSKIDNNNGGLCGRQ